MVNRVVIVDDTQSLRDLMRGHVEKAGMEVVGEAADGLEAVTLVRATQPDAVILDVEMPVMDGIQALPGLRDAAPDTKIVVFSSRTDPDTEASAYHRGAAAVYFKGQATSAEVADHLRRLLDPDEG